MESNQTTRVLELLKRFNNGEKICIDRLIKEAINDSKDDLPNLWRNYKYIESENIEDEKRALSEKTIRRDLAVIKDNFKNGFELIRGGKGEKGCYKAITKKVFDNFMHPDVLSLMVQTFNIANKSNLFDNFDLDDSDKRILESKIKEKDALYEFKNKPFETKKDDMVIFKALEYAIKYQKYTFIEYPIENKIKKLQVKPYKIIFINENFYIACEIETEELEFAMYRISKIKSIEDNSKQFQINPEIKDFIKDIQTPFPKYKSNYKDHLIDIILEVDSEKEYFFSAKKHLKSQEKLEKKENGNLLVKFRVTQEKEVEELIKQWIPYVKVIKPLTLKKKIEDELKEYLNQ